MRIRLTRDSVAAGDDVDAPHDREVAMPDSASLGDVVDEVDRQGYLACIAGGDATWLVVAGGAVQAVVAQQWKHPGWVTDPNAPAPEAVHFQYLAQRDPTLVLAELQKAGR